MSELAPRAFRRRACRSARPTRSVSAAQLALAEPHEALVASVLQAAAVNVDETGWTTAGNEPHALDRDHPGCGDLPDRGRSSPRPARRAARPRLRRHLLLRPLVGLQPHRPRKPPSLLESPPARFPLPRRRAPHPEAVRRARPRAHQPPLPRLAQLPANTKTAAGSNTRSPRSRAELRTLVEEAARKTPKNKYHRGLRQQPAQDLARALDVRHRRRRRADQQRRRTITPRTSHPPQTLPRHPQPRRRTLHRTRTLRLGHLPPTETLALRLPHRPAHRPRPRRPAPHPHLNRGTERLHFVEPGRSMNQSAEFEPPGFASWFESASTHALPN